MRNRPYLETNAMEQRIRAIAYALWEGEGFSHGRATSHRLLATRLAEAEMAASRQAMPSAHNMKNTDTFLPTSLRAIARDEFEQAKEFTL